MTLRLRPATKRKRRTHWESEERTQFWVTLGFLAVVALAFLILGGAVAARYYDEHFKVIARVEGKEINQDQWQLRQKVATFRLDEAESRIRERLSAGTIDSAKAQQDIQSLDGRKQSVANDSLEGLIDQMLQSQIASKVGVSVTDADVDAALKKDASRAEARKVLAIFVQPEQTAGASKPTDKQKAAARERANKALAELNAGKPFADVAKTYSSDASKDQGGDFGYIDAENATDEAWVAALFRLPLSGTTGVVEGADGVLRIGRVAQILPAVVDDNYSQKVDKAVGLAAYRDALVADLLQQKLRDHVAKESLTGDVEQVHAYEIAALLEGDQPGQPDAGAEVQASHILYSPKDDPQGAADIPETDASWTTAKKQADDVAARLRAITDVAAREKEFAKVAKSDSDDEGSGAKGGDLGFVKRTRVVQEFGTAIFDGEHAKGDIIGPVKTQFGYHVILFEQKRTLEQKIQEIVDLLKKPGADFQAIAKAQSDASNASQGGDLGWIARLSVEKAEEDVLFRLQAGQVSEAQLREDGYHIYKVTEREKRPIDPKDRSSIEANAFKNWYQPQKDAANIYRDPSVTGGASAVQ
jgi:parvulin-like peptidyl-prolyl isomerase